MESRIRIREYGIYRERIDLFLFERIRIVATHRITKIEIPNTNTMRNRSEFETLRKREKRFGENFSVRKKKKKKKMDLEKIEREEEGKKREGEVVDYTNGWMKFNFGMN